MPAALGESVFSLIFLVLIHTMAVEVEVAPTLATEEELEA
jgi:hypothetical protein